MSVSILSLACDSERTNDAPLVGAPADPAPVRDAGDPRARDRANAATPSARGGDAAGQPYVHFSINHVLSTGQSNSVGNDGKPVLSTTQPYGNLMFDVGVMTASGCDGDGCTVYDEPKSLVPLVEGDSYFYPVETPSSGLANEIAKLARERYLASTPFTKHDVLVSVHGRSGNSYGCLRKGGCTWWPTRGYVKSFDDGMRQVEDARALAAAAGRSYVVRAVTTVHGEHDHEAASLGASHFPLPGSDGTSTLADYADALIEWQRDYEAGVKAITGQTLGVPLLVSQLSHWSKVPATTIAYQQLAAHVRAPGKVVVVGPTYTLEHSTDCLHFRAHGERKLGEYFAKAYARIVFEGKPWEPLRPVAITIAGSVITARFLVPKPPLVLDTTAVTDPGNYGFEYTDGSGAPPAIAKVEIASADTVNITLASAPAALATGKRLRYAYTSKGCVGTGTTPRGNLRDSDDTPSQSGYALPNWAVHFDEQIVE